MAVHMVVTADPGHTGQVLLAAHAALAPLAIPGLDPTMSELHALGTHLVAQTIGVHGRALGIDGGTDWGNPTWVAAALGPFRQHQPTITRIAADCSRIMRGTSLALELACRLGHALGRAEVYARSEVGSVMGDYVALVAPALGEAAELAEMLQLDPAPARAAAGAGDRAAVRKAIEACIEGSTIALRTGAPKLREAANWRRCTKCGCMVNGGGPVGACAAGATHAYDPASTYRFLIGRRDEVGQSGWQACTSCSAMFHGAPGRCPTIGGAHTPGPLAYLALSESNPAPASHETGWRWCERCHAMITTRHAGRCVATDEPHRDVSSHYIVKRATPSGLGAQVGGKGLPKLPK